MSDYATFTDELMSLGFRPHPDTVVVRMEVSHLEGVGLKAERGKPAPPMFRHMALEQFGHITRQSKTAPGVVYEMDIISLLYVEPDTEQERLYWVSSFSRAGVNGATTMYSYCPHKVGLQLNEDYFIDEDVTVPYQYDAWGFPGFHLRDVEQTMKAVANIFALWQMLDQHAEMELVTMARNPARRIARKTGKAPSPYVLLTLDTQESIMAGRNSVQVLGSGPRGLHRVRGHFRRVVDHPFIPDGVYYIQPHLRGVKDKGDYRRDYRVVLPEGSN